MDIIQCLPNLVSMTADDIEWTDIEYVEVNQDMVRITHNIYILINSRIYSNFWMLNLLLIHNIHHSLNLVIADII